MNQVPLNPFPISAPTSEATAKAAVEALGSAPKNGRRRQGRPRKPPEVVNPPKAGKAVRRSTKRRAVPAAVQKREQKVSLSLMVSALTGLKEEDGKILTVCVEYLGNVPKASRARIVAALGRIFA